MECPAFVSHLVAIFKKKLREFKYEVVSIEHIIIKKLIIYLFFYTFENRAIIVTSTIEDDSFYIWMIRMYCANVEIVDSLDRLLMIFFGSIQNVIFCFQNGQKICILALSFHLKSSILPFYYQSLTTFLPSETYLIIIFPFATVI